MASKKASVNGIIVSIPKYVNGEMLMLEFFKNDNMTITPMESKGNYTKVGIHMHVDILAELVEYINNNIPHEK